MRRRHGSASRLLVDYWASNFFHNSFVAHTLAFLRGQPIMLCDECTELFRGKLKPFQDEDAAESLAHGTTYRSQARRLGDVQDPSREECYICRHLLLRMHASGYMSGMPMQKNIHVDTWVHQMRLFNPSKLNYLLEVVVRPFRPYEHLHNIRFVWGLENARCLEVEPHRAVRDRPLESNTGSLATANTIRDWLNVCKSTHPSCQEGQEIQWHPRRLIEILPPEHGNEVGSVRIVMLPAGTTVLYTTLSHSWGGVNTTTLTNASCSTWSYGISQADLPKTFQDAVAAVSSLGLEYLWIDSLCIVQDDIVDWQQEASQMSQVYSNAEICIAATAAGNSSEGLFFDRDVELVRPHIVEVKWDGAPHGDYLMSEDSWNYRDGIEYAPLSSRGWVQQERLLSRRTVHFAKKQVFWECRTLVASEGHPTRSPDHIRFPETHDALDSVYVAPRKLWNGPAGVIDANRHDAPTLWFDALKDYGFRQLTVASDRLPAIAGLARVIAANTGDRYVAGMWERDLLFQLDWSSHRGDSTGTYSDEAYIAPSWSWLSAQYNRPVPVPPLLREEAIPLASILSVNLHHATEDIFGRLEEGSSLQLRACSRPVRNTLVRPGSVAPRPWSTADSEAESLLQHAPSTAVFLPLYIRVLPPFDGLDHRYYCGIVVNASSPDGPYTRIANMTLPESWLSDNVVAWMNTEGNRREITLI